MGSQTTEASTTSTTPVDLLTVSGLSIAVGLPIWIVVSWRKSAGSVNRVGIGLSINGTVTGEAGDSDAMGRSSIVDEAASYFSSAWLGPRIANYLDGVVGVAHGLNLAAVSVGIAPTLTAPMPAGVVTDIVIRGVTLNALTTLFADSLHIYAVAIT